MQDLKWIFFDMGYTIVNEDAPHERRVTECIGLLAEQGVVITREAFWEEIYDCGRFEDFPLTATVHRHGMQELAPYHRAAEVAYPGDRVALWRLKRRYKLGIIANQPEGSVKRLTQYGLIDCFDAVFPSAELGMSKPDHEIFLTALRTVGCAAENAMMVGDRPDNDILPAHELGMCTARVMRGVHQRKTDTVTPELKVKDIAELADRLEC